MYYLLMIPDFFQLQEPISHFGVLQTIVGLFIVLFASFVGVEIRIDNDDDDP